MKWLGRLTKFFVALFVLSVPLLGVWTASSMAAYWNGPIWLALAAGLLLFPILPGLWDIWAMRRRLRRGQKIADRVLTSGDRLLLRTFALNLVFVSLLLWLFPLVSFTALSTRGDWMLDGRTGPAANVGRTIIFASAGGLEWLYQAYHDNPFDEMAESQTQPAPDPENYGKLDVDQGQTDEAKNTDGDVDDADSSSDSIADSNASPPRWPMQKHLYPLLQNMPKQATKSIAAVAQYLAKNEKNPFRLVKALHDFSADHVRYDFAALDAGKYPPQDAQTVFAKGLGVCAGYANLMVALGREAGVEIVFIGGDSRDRAGDIAGGGHAWNAAKIEERWYLIDVTWDAGHREKGTFKKDYNTDYLFTPPAFFIESHFPEDPSWQLLDKPISRGEFMRQPMLAAGFHSAGLKLIDPRRSQISVKDSAHVRIANARKKYMMMTWRPKSAAMDSSVGEKCTTRNGQTIQSSCVLPKSGSYLIMFFVNDQPYGRFASVGQIEVNRF